MKATLKMTNINFWDVDKFKRHPRAHPYFPSLSIADNVRAAGLRHFLPVRPTSTVAVQQRGRYIVYSTYSTPHQMHTVHFAVKYSVQNYASVVKAVVT